MADSNEEDIALDTEDSSHSKSKQRKYQGNDETQPKVENNFENLNTSTPISIAQNDAKQLHSSSTLDAEATSESRSNISETKQISSSSENAKGRHQ